MSQDDHYRLQTSIVSLGNNVRYFWHYCLWWRIHGHAADISGMQFGKQWQA